MQNPNQGKESPESESKLGIILLNSIFIFYGFPDFRKRLLRAYLYREERREIKRQRNRNNKGWRYRDYFGYVNGQNKNYKRT